MDLAVGAYSDLGPGAGGGGPAGIRDAAAATRLQRRLDCGKVDSPPVSAYFFTHPSNSQAGETAGMTIELQPERAQAPETLTIGVLALQGAFHEHIAYLNR